MKRLLLFTESMGAGGAERQLTGLAMMLKEQGYEVKVLYYGDKHFYIPFLKEHGVDYEYRPVMMNKYFRPFHLVSYIRKSEPDVVISYLSSCNMTACMARLLSRKKLIVSERTTHQKMTLKDRILFALYHLSDAVVPNSHSQEKFIFQNFPSLFKKIHVITNFVDTEYFQPKERGKTIYGKERKPLKILTAARITIEKNLIRYLEAIKILKQRSKVTFHVDWFGNIYSEVYEKRIKQLLIEYDLEDVFTLFPASAQIVNEYQQADIFCLPSLYEGYPNTICEAMSCGCPIVCSRVCDNPQIVQEYENGLLFNPQNVEDIVEKLLEMLHMTQEKRQVISENNRARALELFSKDAFVSRYVKLIESV